MIHTDYSWEIREREGLLVVRLAGEIDHHNAVRLRGDVDELLLGKRPRRLVLDLSRVDFMDSAGIGFLMGRCRLMRELGGVLNRQPPLATAHRDNAGRAVHGQRHVVAGGRLEDGTQPGVRQQ